MTSPVARDNHQRRTSQIAIGWMLVSSLCLASTNAMTRQVTADLHPFQVSFLVNTIIMVMVWPALRLPVDPVSRPQRIRLYLLVGIFGGTANLFWFYALANMPISEATAISFAAPIIVTALSGILFRERVTLSRWAAVLAGFAGVWIIVRPGVVSINLATAAILMATIGMAAMFLISKRLGLVDQSRRSAAMMTLISALIGLGPAIWFWKTPHLTTVFWLMAMGATNYTGRLTMLMAFRHAPASTVMPFDFTRLPFVAVICFFAYGEVPDHFAILGSLIITAASLFVIRQERQKDGDKSA